MYLSITISLIICYTINSIHGTQNTKTEDNPGNPLFLTPLIANGDLSKAMELSRVSGFEPVESYSGFITVDAAHNSNIFFWFFPAENTNLEKNTAPVLLWSDGGPGCSCGLSIFGQNGPFLANAQGDNYTLNPNSWTKKYNMIYLDSPVEVGKGKIPCKIVSF